MKGDDGEASTALQHAHGTVQQVLQGTEFIIDGDTQGLETAGGRVLFAFARQHTSDEVGELLGGGQRGFAALLHNATSDGACGALFAVLVQDVGQFLFRGVVDQVGRALRG